MKKLILLILLIPALCFAQVGSDPKPTTANKSQSPFAPDPNWTKEDESNFRIVVMSDFVICRSPRAIISESKIMKCVAGPEAKINLFNLYQNKFHLIQVIKSEKEYIYYLEKKSAQ